MRRNAPIKIPISKLEIISIAKQIAKYSIDLETAESAFEQSSAYKRDIVLGRNGNQGQIIVSILATLIASGIYSPLPDMHPGIYSQ